MSECIPALFYNLRAGNMESLSVSRPSHTSLTWRREVAQDIKQGLRSGDEIRDESLVYVHDALVFGQIPPLVTHAEDSPD